MKHLAPERLAPYIDLSPHRATETPHQKIDTADHLDLMPDFDFQAYIFDNLPNTQKNLTIIPVEDGVAVGISQESGLLSTFLLNGFRAVNKNSGDNLIFLIKGTKLVKTGDCDDVIFSDNVNELDGFIDAKKGDDTLVLVNNKESITLKSETGKLMALSESATQINRQL